jgi:hypothetical protein
MPKLKRTFGPTRSTRLPLDDDAYLLERVKKTGLDPALFMRAWMEKAIRLERRREKKNSKAAAA